jgi:signal transduction histidine kinase
MTRDVLLIASMEGVANCAKVLEQQLSTRVEVSVNRKDGLAALRREQFGAVVVEEGLAEGDPLWADHVWDHAGSAAMLQVNFVLWGCARLGREIKAALTRREGDQLVARRAVAQEMDSELRSSLTGLLLQSQLALREPTVPAALAPKLRHMVELAGAIRERLDGRQSGKA